VRKTTTPVKEQGRRNIKKDGQFVPLMDVGILLMGLL